MKQRIPSLDDFINENSNNDTFVIKNSEGQFLKSFQPGALGSEWSDDANEAKQFNSEDQAFNVMGYHIERSIANNAVIEKYEMPLE